MKPPCAKNARNFAIGVFILIAIAIICVAGSCVGLASKVYTPTAYGHHCYPLDETSCPYDGAPFAAADRITESVLIAYYEMEPETKGERPHMVWFGDSLGDTNALDQYSRCRYAQSFSIGNIYAGLIGGAPSSITTPSRTTLHIGMFGTMPLSAWIATGVPIPECGHRGSSAAPQRGVGRDKRRAQRKENAMDKATEQRLTEIEVNIDRIRKEALSPPSMAIGGEPDAGKQWASALNGCNDLTRLIGQIRGQTHPDDIPGAMVHLEKQYLTVIALHGGAALLPPDLAGELPP